MASNNSNKLPYELELMAHSVFEEIRKEYFQHFNIDMFNTDHKIKKQDIDKYIEYWKNELDKILNLLSPNEKIDTRLMLKKQLILKFYFGLLQDTEKIPKF